MKFSRKNLQLYIRKSPWKIDVLTIFFSYFLGFRRLLANFSPFTFSLLRFGLGNFSGWCGIQAGWGGGRVPPCQGMFRRLLAKFPLFTFSLFRFGGIFRVFLGGAGRGLKKFDKWKPKYRYDIWPQVRLFAQRE